jgi:H+/Cl- antiporter ClcA
VVPALATSVLATAIARALLGSEPQYAVSHFPSSLSLTVYSILVGPLLGLAGSAFSTAARAARAAAPRDARLLVWCPAVMLGVGVCAIPFPQILGNGEATLQLTFNGPVGWELGICLLILRIACPLATLRAGASGGTLTPSLAIGGALAALLGGPWSRIWPGVPAGAFSIVGAAAFLSATMHPLAAVIITAELARVDVAFLVPTICAVAGSSAVRAITRTR